MGLMVCQSRSCSQTMQPWLETFSGLRLEIWIDEYFLLLSRFLRLQFHMHFVLLRQAESQTRDVVSMRRDSTVQTQPESLRQTYQDMVDPIVDDSQPFQRSESPEEEILTRCSVGWCSGVADYTVEQEFASPDFSEGDLPSQQDVPAAPAASAGSVRPLGRFRFLHLNSRPTKYGLCTSCGIARKLHLVKSGRAAGQIWVRCGNFWVRGNDDKPLCWHGRRWLGDVPRSVLRHQAKLRQDLRWQLQHGPQTKR